MCDISLLGTIILVKRLWKIHQMMIYELPLLKKLF
jgi:hypothetical protein